MTADPNLIAALEPLVRRVRTDVTATRGEDGVQWRKREPLTPERLAKHLNGGPARGVCPIKPGETTTMVAVLDLDSHKGEVPWEQMAETAEQVMAELKVRGLHAHPWRSGGGNGIHLIMLWDEPQDAYSVRRLLVEVLVACGYTNGTGGVAKRQIEVFPKQDSVPEDGFGNQFFLPLGGKSEPLLVELGLAPGGKQEAVGYQWHASAPVPVLEKPSKASTPSRRVEDPEMLDRALQAIPNDIDDRDEWFRLMCAYKDGGGDKEVARNWTAQHPSYDDDKFDGPWDSIEVGKQDGATVDYLFRVAHERAGFDEHIVAEFPVMEPAPPKPSRFQFQPLDQFVRGSSMGWWVKGVLPRASLAVVYGASGSGKTFAVLDLAFAIARGVEWRGRRVKQGRVAYIAAEGADGFKKRIQAYGQDSGVDLAAVPMRALDGAPNLMLIDDVTDLAKAVEACGGADVIVVDTLAQTTPGANENASEDMGRAVGHCRKLREMTGALVLLVHHSGKDQAKGARGWSGLRAACDAEVEVVKTEAGARYLRLSKNKDGEDGLEWGFELQQVTLGTDEDGDPITSCVMREAEINKAKAIGRELGPNEAAVNQAIQEFAKNQTAGIEVAEVIKRAVELLPPPEDGKRDTRRMRVKRALETLCNGDEAPYWLGDDGCISVV